MLHLIQKLLACTFPGRTRPMSQGQISVQQFHQHDRAWCDWNPFKSWLLSFPFQNNCVHLFHMLILFPWLWCNVGAVIQNEHIWMKKHNKHILVSNDHDIYNLAKKHTSKFSKPVKKWSCIIYIGIHACEFR